MSSRSREKIALVVFVVLILLSLCGLGWYLFAGHSWNVAASNIDDTFGSMDDYTAIIYAGTAQIEEEESDKLKDPLDAAAKAESNDKTKTEPGAAAKVEPDGETKAEPDAKTKAELADGQAKNMAAGTLDVSASKKTLSVDDAKESYEGKGATVFSLNTLQPDMYSEGTILKKGTHRFGVFSVTKPTPARLIEKQVTYFAEHKVDFIVVITSDKSFVEDASGIDIVISTQDEDLFVMGETINATFYVDAPETGKVGVILISPSNVVSAKVIEEL